jgi:hypothetical protein
MIPETTKILEARPLFGAMPQNFPWRQRRRRRGRRRRRRRRREDQMKAIRQDTNSDSICGAAVGLRGALVKKRMDPATGMGMWKRGEIGWDGQIYGQYQSQTAWLIIQQLDESSFSRYGLHATWGCVGASSLPTCILGPPAPSPPV